MSDEYRQYTAGKKIANKGIGLEYLKEVQELDVGYANMDVQFYLIYIGRDQNPMKLMSPNI